jgi:hydrogenase maturation protein HypF
MKTYRVVIDGHVQGVGFRPFIYRLAHSYQFSGWVKNLTGTVEVVFSAELRQAERFVSDIVMRAPAIAQPHIVGFAEYDAITGGQFVIAKSCQSAHPHIALPPDYSVCKDCIKELRDPENHRYQYPFINCTQCGPRYTIIKQLPYDRPVTTMSDFPMCVVCEQEYHDPLNRRFDAQPIACPDCGPILYFYLKNSEEPRIERDAIQGAVDALNQGLIVAMKGIGGYHLCCDATNEAAVQKLRARKHRPDKPLAVMFPATGEDELSTIEDHVSLSSGQKVLLLSAVRPIVVIDQPVQGLAKSVTLLNQGVGAMLPYSPLHYCVLDQFKKPMVATSANLLGEPVMTLNDEVTLRLSSIADGFLHHNRQIERPADDPVYRLVNQQPYPIRMGRGVSPLELSVGESFPEAVLAVGAFTKNTIAIGWEGRVVLSPHIGDLSSRKSMQVFAQMIEDLQALYQVTVTRILCDAHTGYSNSLWANKQPLPVTTIYHHQAHASALYAEHQRVSLVMMFTWDGVGLGQDGLLWGGELMLGKPGQWRRVGSMRSFRLPGNDKVARQPWRSAASIGWEMNLDLMPSYDANGLLKQAWEKQLNSPETTAIGRLFDAAAAILGVCQVASFEGQGPAQLEACCSDESYYLELPIVDQQGVNTFDWQPLMMLMLDESYSVEDRAAIFHNSLAYCVLNMACLQRNVSGVSVVGLTGGVFQNRRLVELCTELLKDKGFRVLLPKQVPCNDSGIAFGQLMEWRGRQYE